MRVFFSGIGGTAIGPLALIAKQAGYEVMGSDEQDSAYISYLKEHAVKDIKIGQSEANLKDKAIDWFVYSSALPANHPELSFAQASGIKTSKRDEFINQLLSDKNLKMIAVAGTHGKTTTTAMVVWLFKQLGLPVSYSLGAKISFGDMGEYKEDSEYFVYECDEFDRNFLAFSPYLSLITGLSWDHHEIYPTREEYKQAFRDFVDQSGQVILWQDEYDYLKLKPNKTYWVLTPHGMPKISLPGQFNRYDAWLAVQALAKLTKEPVNKLMGIINRFPGLQRRMEPIVPGLYSDYAHTPEKIRGAMSVALEMSDGKPVTVIYEPLTNRRQHYMAEDYSDCFSGATKVYWLPSYLAREDPSQRIILPEELISKLSNPHIAEPKKLDDELKETIQAHIDRGDMVVAMAGGGGGSLDDWLRDNFKN